MEKRKKNLQQQGVVWNPSLLHAESTERITESKAVTSEEGQEEKEEPDQMVC